MLNIWRKERWMLANPFLQCRIMKSFVPVCELLQQTSPRFWMNLVQLYFNRSHILISLECVLLAFTAAFVATCLWKRVVKAEIQEHYEAFFFFFLEGFDENFEFWVIFFRNIKCRNYQFVLVQTDTSMQSPENSVTILKPLMKESNFMCGCFNRVSKVHLGISLILKTCKGHLTFVLC